MVDRRHILLGGGALALAGAAAAVYGEVRQMGSMEEYGAAAAAARATLASSPAMAEVVRYATLAANGHNTQPWRFRIGDGGIDILPDFSRRTPAVDPDDHHLFVSLGCAAENLAIAAAARDRPGEVRFAPGDEGAVAFRFGSAANHETELFEAIPKRRSTRGEYDGRPIAVDQLRVLSAAATVPGVELFLITDRPRIDRVRDLVVAGNTAQMANPAFINELKSWLRFNPAEAMRTGDGLFTATSGAPMLPTWLGRTIFDWGFSAKAENDKYARQIDSSSGIAVFVSQREDREHWVSAGRAAQRFALRATALGLRHAFVNQAVEVASLRPELAALLGVSGRRPDLVIRFGHGPALPFSARRPVPAVLV